MSVADLSVLNWYLKKYSNSQDDFDHKEKAKRVRYLMYRGFSYEQIDFAMQAQ